MKEHHFEFGNNWKLFLESLTEDRIKEAERTFVNFLGLNRLEGKSFLDVGSGSGLFSLVARRLGARVYSFDYDGQSVACTQKLKDDFFPNDPNWTIEKGSALDRDYLKSLGPFDIVYSWGVLHHTGNMNQAIRNIAENTNLKGFLYLALYNDQGAASIRWKKIKKWYCALPPFLKWIVLYPCALRLWGPTMIKDFLTLKPFKTWRDYKKNRGMSPWRNVVDWVGGYPFEVAKPDEIKKKLEAMNFTLVNLKTVGRGHGCNEYLFLLNQKLMVGHD